MENIQEFEHTWKTNTGSVVPGISAEQLHDINRNQVKKQVNTAMQFFWKSFVYQIVVYAILAHVIIRYHDFNQVVILCCMTMLAFIPFTTLLIIKFKQFALTPIPPTDETMAESVERKERILRSFYEFKRKYEYFLIPLSCFAVTSSFSELYLLGGVRANVGLTVICFLIALGSCMYALYRENKNNFVEPLAGLDSILKQLK